jgi:hypothetical protein
LGERLICIQEVAGSIPTSSTKPSLIDLKLVVSLTGSSEARNQPFLEGLHLGDDWFLDSGLLRGGDKRSADENQFFGTSSKGRRDLWKLNT